MKSKKRKKGISLQTAAFVCTVLAAVLAGAWFLFPVKEMLWRLPQAVEVLLPPAAETTPPLPADDKESLSAGGEKQAEQAAKTEQQQPEVAPAATEPAADPAKICAVQTEGLRRFFSSLEQQDYIKEFKLKKPVEEHLNGLTAKLAAKRPAVLRETDDLYTVLANTAHLFRTLGPDNLRLLKRVLEQEQDKVEEIAAALHMAAITGRCPGGGLNLAVPFETAYEYAGFFLNTMGGRAYLFRRDARTRLLASYYAILLIDEANSRNLNAYGIDLAGILPGLLRDVEASGQLVRKEEYLAKIRELAAKYPVRQ